MTTKYAALVRIGLVALVFILAAGAAALLSGTVAAQDPSGSPAGPAQADTPDIIGGREAEPGAWPWQVALVSHFQENAYLGQFCGGSLIGEDWVLTAAHCVQGTETSFIDVLVGAHRLSDSGTRIQAAQIIPHPDYDPTTIDNDLALIRLSTPVTYTPISVYQAISGTSEYDFVRATVIGWGAKNYDWISIDYPDALREVSVPLVSNEKCAQYLYYEVLTGNMICAGYDTLTKGACYGDSGGPLMVQKPDASWAQIGIVSWGPYGCTSYGQYDVFTRASRYTDWITQCTTDPNGLQCRGGDGYEPDNGPGTAQQLTGPIVNQMHTFHESGDQDWVRYDVEAGKNYIFLTARITDTVDYVNTILWLFDADGFTPITYTEGADWWESYGAFGFMESAKIIWKADRTGPVYVSVEVLPDYYGQVYGPSTRYWLTVGEYAETYLPAVVGPDITPTPEPPIFCDPFLDPFCPIAVTPIPITAIPIVP